MAWLGPAEAAEQQLILRVVPEGTKANEGSYPTLSAALAQAAKWRLAGGNVVVELAPGIHRLERPIQIGPDLSGTADAPLVIRGAPDGSSRLTGSQRLRPVAMPADLRARLRESARGRVRAYRLPDLLRSEARFREPKMLNDPAPRVTEVFDRTGALRPARWPNQDYAPVLLGGKLDPKGFIFTAPPGRDWDREPDLWAEGFWQWDWLLETIPVERAEPDGGRIALANAPWAGERSEGRAAIFHALSELDEPGEWWRDRKRGLLLAWPREGAQDLEIGVAESLLDLVGARHVRIENLRLDEARRDLVVVRGGEDVAIRHSELGWAAGRAAVFENVAGGGLDACNVHDVGATAVRLAAGDRKSLSPGGLFLRDSRLTKFARLSQTQNPAVQIDGVGAQVVGNYVHDAIGYAVHLRGNDHLFANNEVARLMKGLGDSGAIYAGRDWTARGAVIRDNYVHDIEPAPGREVKGVYLDDMASGFTVEGNLFVNVQKPVFIGGGSDNIVSGNVFVSSSPAISLDSRGQTWMAEAVSNPGSEIRGAYAAVPVDSAVWRKRYPRLAGLLSDEPKVARNNRIVGNVYVNSRPLFTEQEGDPLRQVMLRNSELTQSDLAQPGRDPGGLIRQLEQRGLAPALKLQTMRRDTLPESPFAAP